MKKFIATIAFCLPINFAQAQSTEELAQTYMNMPEVQQMISNMYSTENYLGQMLRAMPQETRISEDQFREISAMMAEEMAALRPKIETLMTATLAKYFSTEELEALISIYDTEHGAVIMGRMPLIMQTVMVDMSNDFSAMQQRVVPQMAKILLDQGN